ncbi:MAG: NAD(+) diphosphatase [Gammaproteobacteria bacterium]|nr:NAD(+) diphosphatase [Gammaproteobacteria bacterium]
MSLIHTFAGNPLDRGDAQRRDPEWLATAAAHPNSRYLPFSKLNVLLQGDEPELGWINTPDIALLSISDPPIFLGIKDDIAHFAIDVSELGNPSDELKLDSAWRFEDCRAAGMVLSAQRAGIVAQSRSQLEWHRRHRFCSVCGSPSVAERGGHVRRCPSCRAEHFPRTDPVAIMLITNADDCLLGQSAGRLARTGMYSALAGFIDQGESIEEAVRREVYEEAGVSVGEVQYHSSQPWPFPSSLMIGCHGQATSTEIVIDPSEMADVGWFSRAAVRQALDQTNPQLKVPGPIAIAHHLIKSWANGDIRW